MPDLVDIPAHYGQQFLEHVQHDMQQRVSKFVGHFSEGSYRGASATPVKIYGEADYAEETSRHEDTPIMGVARDRRWIFPANPIEFGDLIDRADVAKELTDPTSNLVQAAVMAMNRGLDDRHIEAFFADVKSGEKAATNNTFPTSQDIAVEVGATAATGMNVAKLDAVIELFMANEYDGMNNIRLAMTSAEYSDLWKLYEAKDKNIRGFRFDANGKLIGYQNIDFLHSQRLKKNADNTARMLPAWVPEAMQLGWWQRLQQFVGPDTTKKWNTRIYLVQQVGAVRLEDKGVARVYSKV